MTMATLGLVAALSQQVPAQEVASAPSDVEVRAAFLYRFLDYVDWEKSRLDADQAIVIGIVASDEMLDQVRKTVAGRRARGHTIEVRKMAVGDDPAGVQVVYVGASSGATISTIAKRAQAASALVVTNADNALAQGSDINFIEADGRVRFEVDLSNVERSGLKLGSGMLSVAMRVRGAS
jgi:hypothetical protein